MAFFGFVLAFMFFCHLRKQMRRARRESMGERDHHELDWLVDWRRHWADWNRKWAEQAQRYGDHHAEWHRQWAKRMERHVERDRRRSERRAGRHCGPRASWAVGPEPPRSEEEQLLQRARSRAAAEIGFYVHLTCVPRRHRAAGADQPHDHLATRGSSGRRSAGASGSSRTTWACSARALLRERYFEPAVEREVRREKVVMQTEKQASIDELSSTIAHEIRNPDRRRQEPGAADGRGSARRSRTSSTPRSRSTSSTASSAASRTSSSTPRRRTTRSAPVNLATRGRRGAHAAARQARRRQGARRCATTSPGRPIVADGEKLKPGVRQRARQRHRRLRRRRRRTAASSSSSRTAAAARRCACATTAAASRRTRSSASSIPFFTTKEKGTGLGMAISQEDRRGARRARSTSPARPGRGTEFVVTLPLPAVSG